MHSDTLVLEQATKHARIQTEDYMGLWNMAMVEINEAFVLTVQADIIMMQKGHTAERKKKPF